jgi:hypothetical protein
MYNKNALYRMLHFFKEGKILGEGGAKIIFHA